MENKQLFEVFSLQDRSKREEYLRCVTKGQKTAFCTSLASELVAKSIPISTCAENNFIDHCNQKLISSIGNATKIDSIKTVTSWMKNRNISFDVAITSAEACWAYEVLVQCDSCDADFQYAGEFLKMCVLLMDVKVSSNELFIQRILELALLFPQNLSIEKSKVLCQLFTALGDKVFQQSIENIEQNERILAILCECACNKTLCESTFPFWKKLPCYLKSNRRYEKYIEEFVKRLMNHCCLTDEMETNANDGLLVYRENASDLLEKLAVIMDLQKLLDFLLKNMQICCAADVEVCLFVTASVGKKIDRAEDRVMPKIVEFILKFPEETPQPVISMSLKLFGQLDGWVSSFHHVYLADILNFLVKFIDTKMSTSSIAVMSLGQICYSCGRKMEPHLKGIMEIFKNLKSLSILSRAELSFIKGITCAICSVENRQELLPQLFNIQFERISQDTNDEDNFCRSIDQFAEIYHNLKLTNEFDGIFIQHWSIFSNLLDIHQSNGRVMKKIIECIECAVPNIGLSVLPVLDQMVKRLMYYYASRNYDFLLRLMTAIVDKLAVYDKFKDGFIVMFEGVSMLTINALHDEKKLNFPMIEEYFRLASSCVQKMTLELLKSPLIIPILELAIELLKIDGKSSSRMVLRFFTTILGINRGHPEINLCVGQIMAKYGEGIIKNLLDSSVFTYDSSLVITVVDIFHVFKEKSPSGFAEIFGRNLAAIRRKNLEGKTVIHESDMRSLFEIMRSPKSTKTEMVNALTNFRKLVRG